MHKVGNVEIYANFLFLHVSSFLHLTYASKCGTRNQRVHQDYCSRLDALLDLLIFNGRAKTKLAMLYCREFVKKSTDFMK